VRSDPTVDGPYLIKVINIRIIDETGERVGRGGLRKLHRPFDGRKRGSVLCISSGRPTKHHKTGDPLFHTSKLMRKANKEKEIPL
jgi:hypothetical protein